MAKFDTALISHTTLFTDNCNSSNYRLKGLCDIDPTVSDNIMPLLQNKHPQLTAAQHNERILIAMHEAAHLTVALALGTAELGPYGFIRLPGRSSASTLNNHRGIAGRVTCGSYDQADDVIISFAGCAISELITEPNARGVSADDEKQAIEGLDELLRRYNVATGVVLTVDERREYEYHFRDCALRLVVLHLPVIEKVATAMLLSCDQNGDIQGRKWWRMIEYAKNELENQQAFYEYQNTRVFSVAPWIYDALSARGMENACYMPDRR